MEALRLIIVVMLLSGCSSTKSILHNNRINPLHKVLSQVDKSITSSDCNGLSDSIENYYFKASVINKNIKLINISLQKLATNNNKDRFIKRRRPSGCFELYYELDALKESINYSELSNNKRVIVLFNVLKNKRKNNENLGYEIVLLEYFFNKHNTFENFREIYRIGNDDEKNQILNIVIGSKNIEKKYSFLNSIDYDNQSKTNQSIITLYKRLSLEELKRRKRN